MVELNVKYDSHSIIDRDWLPHPGPQTDALRRSEFEVLYGGARGGGKTESGLAWLAEPAYMLHPMYKALIIRRNYDDLSDWIHRARLFYRDLAVVSGNPAEIRWKAGGVCRTGHLKDPSTYTKYIGHEYQKMLIEELTLIPNLDDYLRLLGSCRSTIMELKPQLFATTNPGGPGHSWVKKRWVEQCKLKAIRDPDSGRTRVFIPARVEDNPTLMTVDPGYVKYLESLPEQLMRAWRLGDWDSFEGMFFPMFDQKDMGIKPFEIPDAWTLIGSLDPGWNSPCSFGLQARDFAGNVYRLFTYYERSIDGSPQSHAEAIFDRVVNFPYTGGRMPDYVIAGHDAFAHKDRHAIMSSELTYADIFKVWGFNLRKASVGPNSRVPGWWAWKGLMTEKKWFYFLDFNEPLTEEILGMSCDDRSPEDIIGRGNDDRIADHAIDECRYAVISLKGPLEPEKPEEKHEAKYRFGAPLPMIDGLLNDIRKFW